MSKTIMVRVEKCLACRSCEIACALAHAQGKTLEQALAERPGPQKRISVVAAEGRAVPLQCRHCEEAPCLAVCPSGALHRSGPQDPVLIHTERCIGCKFCMMVCPFGVIESSRDGRAATKCDLCFERTRAQAAPACVESCPTRALQFVEVQEWTRRRREQAARAIAAERADFDHRGEGDREL